MCRPYLYIDIYKHTHKYILENAWLHKDNSLKYGMKAKLKVVLNKLEARGFSVYVKCVHFVVVWFMHASVRLLFSFRHSGVSVTLRCINSSFQ